MAEVGSVQVSVRLGLDQLRQDAAKAQSDLAKAIDDVTVNISASGLGSISREIKNARTEAEKGVNIPVSVGSGADIASLAQSLNMSFREAKQFAEGLGLSAEQANRAIGAIGNLNNANATTVEKFRVLARELGINKTQFLGLEQAIASATTALNKPIQTTGGITSLAKVLNLSFKEAQNFAASIGLTADQVSQAITVINGLNAVNATAVEKFKAVSQELGVSAAQFIQLEDAIAEAVTRINQPLDTSGQFAALAQSLSLSYGEAQRFATSLGLTADQANRAIAIIGNLNTVNATTEQKFKALAQEVGITEQQYQQLEAAIAQTNQQLKGFDGILQNARDFADAVSAASQYTQALRDVQQILGQAGQQINQFTQQALGAASGFENAKASAETLAQDIDGLTASLSDLTKELDFQTNTTDLLNASTGVLGSGFDKTADATEILRASFVGAQGGLTDIGTVSNAVVSALNAFNLEASDAARIVDILAATVDAGNISFEQVANGFGEINSVAALAGLSLEEVGAAIAQATAAGQQGPAAISGVRQALINLIKPTEDSKEALKQFGIENASAIIRSEGLIGVLTRLQAQGATSDDLARIFSDVTGLATVATLAGDNLDDFREKLDFTTNSAGKASAASSIVAKTFDTQVSRAFNLANESLVSLGKGVQSAILPLVDAIVFLLENFNKLPEPIKELTGVTVALSGGALTAAAAIAGIAAVLPVVNAAVGSVAKLGENLLELGANGKTVAGNIKAIAPQLLAVAAAGAAVAVVADRFREITEVSGETRQGIKSIEEALRELKNSEVEAAQAIDNTDESIQAAVDANIKAVEDRINGLQQFLDMIAEKLEGLLSNPIFRTAISLVPGAGVVANAGLAVAPEDEEGNVNIPTAKEAAVNQQAAAFEDLVAKSEDALQAFDRFNQAGLGNKKPEELKALNDALQLSVEELNKAILVEEEDFAARDAKVKQLQAAQAAIAKYIGTTEDLATATATTAAETRNLDEELAALDAQFASDRIALAERFAQGLLDQEQYQNESQSLERKYLSDRIALNQQKLEELRQIQSSATSPDAVEEAAAEILAVEKQISIDRLAVAESAAAARVAAEEAATQKILDNLEQQSADVQTGGDISIGGLDIESQRISEQQSLLSAQNDLLSAQFGIREQNLQAAIDAAEADENTAEAARLQNQLEQERDGFLTQQFEIKRQQLELTQKQRAIDLERQKILSEISLIEAQIAIEKAEAEGASAAEIKNLTRIAELRQREVDSVNQAISSQEQINELEDKTLAANEELERLKNSQVEAREKEVEKLEEIKALEDELRQARADAQRSENDAAVSSAEAELEANPSASNLNKLQDAREKALQDEFANRQAELDAESKARIGAAEEEAKGAADAYNTALEEFNTGQAAALEDGSISAEEQERLDLLQEQNDQAREQVDAANKQLGLERQIADAKQQQLNTDKKAAIEAEKAKQKKETEDARAAGLLSGVQGGDVNTLTAARNQLRQITDQVNKFGPGRQIQELLNFARQDSRFKGNGGQFNDVLLNQLGGLGQAALNLESIAKSGQVGLANDLAKQLGNAQVSGDKQFFDQLIAKIQELASKAGPITINASAPDPIGAAGQILREVRAGDSKARGL